MGHTTYTDTGECLRYIILKCNIQNNFVVYTKGIQLYLLILTYVDMFPNKSIIC